MREQWSVWGHTKVGIGGRGMRRGRTYTGVVLYAFLDDGADLELSL